MHVCSHDQALCVFPGCIEKGCIVEMNDTKVFPDVDVLHPHALLLDKGQDVVDLQEQLFNLNVATESVHVCMLDQGGGFISLAMLDNHVSKK